MPTTRQAVAKSTGRRAPRMELATTVTGTAPVTLADDVLAGREDITIVLFLGDGQYSVKVHEEGATFLVDTERFHRLFPSALAQHLRVRPGRELTVGEAALWGFGDLSFEEREGVLGQAGDMDVCRVAVATGRRRADTARTFLVGGVRDVFHGSADGRHG